MAILKNITNTPSESGDLLIDPDNYSSSISNINISSIMISNNHAIDEVAIDIYIESGTNTHYYLCKGLAIPVGVSLVLDEEFSFNIGSSTLRIETSVDPNLTIIIN